MLGPVEVLVDGERRVISATKERVVLAALIANANRAVDVDVLAEAVWGDDRPRTATKTLQTYVLHLRRVVGAALATRPPGYVLEVDPETIDAVSFERDVARGRLALLRGDAAAAASHLAAALDRWRGRPYEGFDREPFVTEQRRLEELRAGAIDDWLEARLAAEPPEAVVADLEAAVVEAPLRERRSALLMQALYLGGRQGDALRTYERARSALVEELGVEPGVELRRMEQRILEQDPTLHGEEHRRAPTPLYATTSDGLRIGYWTRGTGPPDVVLCAEWVFNLELLWEMPEVRPFLDRLCRASRLIVVQRRGTGVSDRDDRGFALPHDCVPDVDAVLDTLGCGEVALVGWGHGGQVALAYAARRPERVGRMAIVNGYARLSATADYPEGLPSAFLDGFLGLMEEVWGTDGPAVPIFGPEVGLDMAVRTRAGRLNRLIASPREAVAIQTAVHGFDVRADVDRVRVPVLVAHLEGSITGSANARWLASHLPDAQYVELPGYFIPTAAEAAHLGDVLVEFLTARPSLDHDR